MKISIIAVGKIKEKFYKDAVDEYVKRMSRYFKIDIIEVPDEKTPDKISDIQMNEIKKKEAERILSKIKDDAYICTLEIEGTKMNSIEFASLIDNLGIQGNSYIQFIIGGSLGLHASISQKAHKKISFSDFTFPHQLMRVILCEQLYRSCRIIHNEPYHK